MSKLSFVFCPGGWSSPDCYDAVIASLSMSGYDSSKVVLPSVGADPATKDFTEDVTAIRNTITSLLDKDKDVILVLHSYSGIPGSEATKGLGKKNREREGRKGGVARLIFIMAFMVPEGFACREWGKIDTFPPHMRTNLDKGVVTISKEDQIHLRLQDLPPTEAERWVSRQHHSVGCFWSTLTHVGWRYIPTTFVMCTQDRAFGKYADGQIEAAKKAEPTMLDTVETIDSGHFPMLSKVEETVQVLKRAAQKSE